jgi:hypothetical protein
VITASFQITSSSSAIIQPSFIVMYFESVECHRSKNKHQQFVLPQVLHFTLALIETTAYINEKIYKLWAFLFIQNYSSQSLLTNVHFSFRITAYIKI